MEFKIQSISDVITNSSTEVYIAYCSCDKEAIIDIVNAVLSITNGGKFEDYFEFEWVPNEDLLYDKWECDEIETPFKEWIKTLSEDDLFDYHQGSYYNEERNYVEGYIIKAKDPKNARAASFLSHLDSIFSVDTYH